MNTTTTPTAKLVFLQLSKSAFAVHVAGCSGMGRKARMAMPSTDIESDVAEARDRGFVVRFCVCTGRK